MYLRFLNKKFISLIPRVMPIVTLTDADIQEMSAIAVTLAVLETVQEHMSVRIAAEHICLT